MKSNKESNIIWDDIPIKEALYPLFPDQSYNLPISQSKSTRMAVA